ncbi:SAM-dependent methyltransferase [Deltaproteobacteria bacterium Smac51]|nr:SAM-dependent methyltransferase [Deltaproteobacteria bacterium Smac51]
MEKAIWNSVFQKIKGGSFGVHYWDGEEVTFGDGQPAFECRFNAKPSLAAMAADPILTLGEEHMAGIIDFNGDLDSMFRIVQLNPPEASFGGRVLSAAGKGLNRLKTVSKQKENIKAHYDLGNSFFSLWLDDTMSYSCAYFKKDDDSLQQAQLQKIDLVLKKMRLTPGQRLLDIGCGWGWLIMRAAEQYGVEAVGITLSEEQYAEANKRIAGAGLSGRVESRLVNYLELNEPDESFDAVVSIGMFEHVGRDCFRDYFKKVAALLKPGGLTMLHTLTSLTEKETNSWVKKYIFPGGYIPSLREVTDLLPDYDFRTLHIESLRRHYVKTLEIWYENFSKPEVREKVLEMFDERFIRMWSLYLLGAASSLRTGQLDVHQLVLSKGPNNDLPMTLADIYE